MTLVEIEVKLKIAEDLNHKIYVDETEKLCREILQEIILVSTTIVENIKDNKEIKEHPDVSIDYKYQENLNLTNFRIRVLLLLSRTLLWRGASKEALPYAIETLELTEKQPTTKFHGQALGILGSIFTDLSGYVVALDYFQKAIEINEILGDKLEVGYQYGNIGILYAELSDYKKALEFFHRSLDLRVEFDDQSGVAYLNGNIGIIYRELADYNNALEYLLRSLTIQERLGDNYGIALTIGNLGNVYANLEDYPKAIEYFQKALELDEVLENKSGISRHKNNLGHLYWILSEYALSLEYVNESMKLDEELGLTSGVAICTANIGRVYAREDFEGYDPQKAEEYFLKALSINQELNIKKEQYDNHQCLADLYKSLQKWEKYSFHIEKYIALFLEVQSEEATNQSQIMEHRRKLEESERDRQIKLAHFQEQEKILYNILPSQIAERMVAGEKTIAEYHEHVSVFFSDIVGFTKISQQITAEELVTLLNSIFTEFDRIARKHKLEKIKTIGDAYMAVAGAPVAQEDHAQRVVLFAIDVAEFMKSYSPFLGIKPQIRIGLHTGSAVAGIIGENKFAYDLWGDAVNTASRMESHGEPGKIHVTEEFMHAYLNTVGIRTGHDLSLRGENTNVIHFTPRDTMDIKGKGMMNTYFLECVDGNG